LQLVRCFILDAHGPTLHMVSLTLPHIVVADDDVLSKLTDETFEAFVLSETELADPGCAVMVEAVSRGLLVSWSVGTQGGYISSRMVMRCAARRARGKRKGQNCDSFFSHTDILMCSDSSDDNYIALVRAHALRFGRLIGVRRRRPTAATADTLDYF